MTVDQQPAKLTFAFNSTKTKPKATRTLFPQFLSRALVQVVFAVTTNYVFLCMLLHQKQCSVSVSIIKYKLVMRIATSIGRHNATFTALVPWPRERHSLTDRLNNYNKSVYLRSRAVFCLLTRNTAECPGSVLLVVESVMQCKFVGWRKFRLDEWSRPDYKARVKLCFFSFNTWLVKKLFII